MGGEAVLSGYHLTVPENPIARDILDMISTVSRSHPRKGWDDTEALVHFQANALKMISDASGLAAGNFVEGLGSVGLSRFDAVETFVRAKHFQDPPDARKQPKSTKGAAHAPLPALAAAVPAARPAVVGPPAASPTVAGNVVHPGPAGDPVRPAARPGPDLPADGPAVVAAGEGPSGNPGVRRDLRCEKPKVNPRQRAKLIESPPLQESLF
jgi:hypothetical protein